MEVFNGQFWFNTVVGLGGVLLWVLATWSDPTDDTLSGTLGRAVGRHSRSLAATFLSYGLLAVVFQSYSEWTLVAAITTGYTAQSLCQKVLDGVSAKMAQRVQDK